MAKLVKDPEFMRFVSEVCLEISDAYGKSQGVSDKEVRSMVNTQIEMVFDLWSQDRGVVWVASLVFNTWQDEPPWFTDV